MGPPRLPEEQPAGDGEDGQQNPERAERNERVLRRREFQRRLLAIELLGCASARLKLALDLRLPGSKLEIGGKQRHEGCRSEDIDPKPGRIGKAGAGSVVSGGLGSRHHIQNNR